MLRGEERWKIGKLLSVDVCLAEKEKVYGEKTKIQQDPTMNAK